MATLNKRHTYKNGGASYSMPGIKTSVYVGPKMFDGAAPNTIEFDAVNMAEPGVVTSTTKAAREEAKAARDAKRAETKQAREAAREAKRAEVKQAREAAREAKRDEAKRDRASKKAVESASASA